MYRSGVTIMGLCCALLALGCSERMLKGEDRELLTGARIGSPKHPNAKWVGKHADTLLQAYGPPETALNATLLGGNPREAFVYSALNGDACLDAFVVNMNTGIIVDYICQ